MSLPRLIHWQWLRHGNEAFPAMLGAIDAARSSVRLETYIFADDSVGREFLAALMRAQNRGVQVQVLVDGMGSMSLPGNFFSGLVALGGAARIFNPLALKRAAIRNHRKLLVCDEQIAFIGGFNIAQEYRGDGIESGWRDVGLRLEGEITRELVQSFDEMFALADFRHKRLARLWQAKLKRAVNLGTEQLLLGGPGRGVNPIRRALHADLKHAQRVQIIEAYFLPTWRIRRSLMRIARRQGAVELILAGKSDVALSQLAGRSLYRRLMKSGIIIREYQPQILHAKLLVLDDTVYVGSANLDPRSLSINYELMVRFAHPQMATEAREIFGNVQAHSQQIDLAEWRRARSFWTRLKERLAYFILVRVDPEVARQQWKSLPD
jgi:cardiolipin synthase